MPVRFGKMSRTLLACTTLAIGSLSGPASAQTYPEFDPWCVNYFKNYCAGRWQVEGFASFSACWDYYKNASCRYEGW